MSTASGKALDTYRVEARKCVLVCANCHWEIETGMVDSPPAATRFDDWMQAPVASPHQSADRPTRAPIQTPGPAGDIAVCIKRKTQERRRPKTASRPSKDTRFQACA